MNISEKELFFIQNVFNLAKFNSVTYRYELPEEAYAKVDFSDEKTVKLFEKLCKQYSIYYDRSLMFKVSQSSKEEDLKVEKVVEVPSDKVEDKKEVSFIFDDVSNVSVVDIKNIKDKWELFQYLDNTFIPECKFSQETIDHKSESKKYIDVINLNDLINLNLSEENMILAIEHLYDLNISIDATNGLENIENAKYQYLIKSKFIKQLFGEKTNWDIVKPLFEEYSSLKNDLKNCVDKEEEAVLRDALRNKRNQILLANTRLIDYYIMRHFSNNEVPEEDIKQIAYKVVQEQFIDNFDVSRGFRFSTYLYLYLGHHINREINELKAFRIPVHAMDIINKIERVASVITEIKGSVTPDEIATELDMPVEKVVELIRVKREQDFESLTDYEDNWLLEEEDFYYHDEYDPNSWENIDNYDDAFTSTENFEDIACSSILREQIKEVLKTLTPREATVLSMRFGLDDGYPRSLEEVGSEFGVTRERVRQIEAKALRKLRHPSRSNMLKDYLDEGLSR